MENVKTDIEDSATTSKPKETSERALYFNEIDFDKSEVRLIKMNPMAITGIREKSVRPAEGHGMRCTLIEYNGRERLVLENFEGVLKAVVFEREFITWNLFAEHDIVEKWKVFCGHLKFIRDIDIEAVERQDEPS